MVDIQCLSRGVSMIGRLIKNLNLFEAAMNLQPSKNFLELYITTNLLVLILIVPTTIVLVPTTIVLPVCACS